MPHHNSDGYQQSDFRLIADLYRCISEHTPWRTRPEDMAKLHVHVLDFVDAISQLDEGFGSADEDFELDDTGRENL